MLAFCARGSGATSVAISAKALFQGHYLFGQLSDEELDELLSHSRTQRCAAGEVIFLQGSDGDSVMAVLGGRVRISTLSPDGRELVLNMIEVGEIFGEMAFLDGNGRSADATAETACELVVMGRREFAPFLANHPAVALRILAIVAGRLRRTTEQVKDVAFFDLETRLAKQILSLAARHGYRDAQGRVIAARVSQSELGLLAGLSRESVNRQIGNWRRQGLVAFDSGTITLLDKRALQEIARTE
jgi:CRP/FNR family transcriptional regulator, cyclic AMP receptor protein